MAGRIDLWIATMGGNVANVRAGKVRALAVSGADRAEQLPDIPTFKEQGIDLVEPTTWFGIFAPRGTPKEVAAKVNAEVNRILQEPDLKERGRTLGYTLYGGPPDRLAAHLKAEIAKWADAARRTPLK
jgi:tripartite-type tricarboxylate transporter receptor subunit TctC